MIPLKILKASPSFEKEISEIPLEQTKVINDNIRVKPKKVSVPILLNDYEEGVNNKDKYLIINMECQEIMAFATLKKGEDNKKAYVSTINSNLSGMQNLAGRFAKVG